MIEKSEADVKQRKYNVPDLSQDFFKESLPQFLYTN